MKMDLVSTDHLLTTTRAVRKRLDLERPVEPDVLLECLRLAVQAPTGSNAQGWRWLIVRDRDKRAALAESYRKAFDPYIAMQKAMVDPGNRAQMKVVESAEHLSSILHEVPVLVVPCLLGRADRLAPEGTPFAGWSNFTASGFYGSIWPGVWSFMLALRSRGLGSALTTLHLLNEQEVGELLGIPDTVTQAGLIPVAYYKGDDFKPARRRPVEEITYWESWKNLSPQ